MLFARKLPDSPILNCIGQQTYTVWETAGAHSGAREDFPLASPSQPYGFGSTPCVLGSGVPSPGTRVKIHSNGCILSFPSTHGSTLPQLQYTSHPLLACPCCGPVLAELSWCLASTAQHWHNASLGLRSE